MSAAGAVMTASAARAASFGNPDEPPQGATNGEGPGSRTDPDVPNHPLHARSR
jgi:oxalate decarboxylase